MNLFRSISHVLVVAVVLYNGNATASQKSETRYFKYAGFGFVAAASLLDQTNLFSSKEKNKYNRILIKSSAGALGNLANQLERDKLFFEKRKLALHNNRDLFDKQWNKYKYECFGIATQYVIVNGALRLGGDYISVNEDSIDKKCDELLSENVAWVAKPVANFFLDWTYHAATLAIIQGMIISIHQNK